MFFSVKVPMRIGGKEYKTCICYPLNDILKTTIEDLEKKGKAVIYSERKFFCNGKLVTKTKKVVKPSKKAEVKEEPKLEIETENNGF